MARAFIVRPFGMVPGEFREAVDDAKEAGERGDLRLLAYEARDFDWGVEGLRAVGRAQFEIGARAGAKETFEWLLERLPGDVEANQRLAAVYQRPGDLEERHGAAGVSDRSPVARVLLFTGHMVDAEGRDPPRFPRSEAAEVVARAMIRDAVADERGLEPGRIVGIAGGASGGDILFHEVCEKLAIETRLFLALPPPLFSASSVRDAGPGWIERYNRLCARIPPRILGEREALPRWVAGKRDYTIWQRNNLWMLFNALALDAPSLTLIALWDRGRADGPGGTEDLVEQVTARGLKYVRLPAEELKAMR